MSYRISITVLQACFLCKSSPVRWISSIRCFLAVLNYLKRSIEATLSIRKHAWWARRAQFLEVIQCFSSIIHHPSSPSSPSCVCQTLAICQMRIIHPTWKRLIYSYYLTVPCGAWVMLSHSYNHIHQNGYVYPIKLDTGPWNILKPEFPRLFPRQGSLLQLHGCSGSSMCSGRGIVNISLTERTGIPLAQASDT